MNNRWVDLIINSIQSNSELIQVLVSIVSIGIAIYIPFVINNKEKKLQLFDKRLTAYMEMSKAFINVPLMNCIGVIKGSACVKNQQADILTKYYDENLNKLLVEASFLFSKELSKKIKKIIDNRFRINSIISLTERGTSCFSLKDINQFESLLQNYETSESKDEDKEKLKEISMKYTFRTEEFYDISDGIVYDVLSLLKEEKSIIDETNHLQDEVIEEMKLELQLK